jgi:hypothetical protein
MYTPPRDRLYQVFQRGTNAGHASSIKPIVNLKEYTRWSEFAIQSRTLPSFRLNFIHPDDKEEDFLAIGYFFFQARALSTSCKRSTSSSCCSRWKLSRSVGRTASGSSFPENSHLLSLMMGKWKDFRSLRSLRSCKRTLQCFSMSRVWELWNRQKRRILGERSTCAPCRRFITKLLITNTSSRGITS